MAKREQARVVAGLVHPDAVGPPSKIVGESELLWQARTDFVWALRLSPETLDELAAIAEGDGQAADEIVAWALRRRKPACDLSAPWVLERLESLVDTWREDPDSRRERVLVCGMSAPAALVLRFELPRAELTRENRKAAERRLRAEAERVIREHLRERYGSGREAPQEAPRNARWAVLHHLCGYSHEAIAREKPEPDPESAGKVKVKQAVDRFCEFVGLRQPS